MFSIYSSVSELDNAEGGGAPKDLPLAAIDLLVSLVSFVSLVSLVSLVLMQDFPRAVTVRIWMHCDRRCAARIEVGDDEDGESAGRARLGLETDVSKFSDTSCLVWGNPRVLRRRRRFAKAADDRVPLRVYTIV